MFFFLSLQYVINHLHKQYDLLYKSVDWFLYDRDLRHERVKNASLGSFQIF